MIITRTPFRVSFFGGGTDYPAWFRENKGAVLSTTIDKYCYISLRRLPPFFKHKHRIVYSKVETVDDVKDIQHPVVKALLEWKNIREGLEIHHDGDLPARSGLGSSSSFTVGLINAMAALNGQMISKDNLAKDAIFIEQFIIKENVGSQDQISAAYGGFNKIDFHSSGSFSVSPVFFREGRKEELEKHLLLFFTGFSRTASDIAESKIANFKNKKAELNALYDMVQEAINLLSSESPIYLFGKLLHESWKLKRNLSNCVSTSEIDHIYDAAINAGADGGKIIGAGGGGFLLIFAKPENQKNVIKALKNLIYVPFKFEESGSRVVLYQPNGL